jgi:hypothetical protein
MMRAYWPHAKIPDASLAVWFDDVRHLPGEQVQVAVKALYRDGREYPPNGAQIIAKVSELGRDHIDWGEAWKLAKKAAMQSEPQEWLSERCPDASEAVRRLCGSFLTYQLSEESTVRAQFRQVYENVLAAQKRDDAYQGLPSAGLRGLSRGPRKLDNALKALPQEAGL